MRQVANGDDDHGHDGGDEQAPGDVGDAHALVRRERREREIRLMQPVPARDPGEDERSGSRGHEPREERAPDLLRGDLPACGRHLEQEKCCDQRSPEERGYRREGAREGEELGSRSLQPNQPDRDRAETEPEGDQRGFGAENEPEPQASRVRRGGCWRARSGGSGLPRDLPGESVRRGPAAEPQLQPATLRARERG